MEKIAVHVPTQELWDKVIRKGKMTLSNFWDSNEEKSCLYPGRCSWGAIDGAGAKDAKIISAEEYLKEGEDVSEESESKMKFGVSEGQVFSSEMLCSVCGDRYGGHSGLRCNRSPLKINKLKPIKEESNMSEVNKTVKEVFGKETGDDMMLVDKYYGNCFGSSFLELLAKKYKKDILADAIQRDKDEKKAEADKKAKCK